MVRVSESYTALGPEKSLQQIHFPVSALHSPPVLAHLGSHGEGRGGFLVQLGFLKKEKNRLFYNAIEIWEFGVSNTICFFMQFKVVLEKILLK